MQKIKLIKFLDQHFGSLLLKLLPAAGSLRCQSVPPQSILIVRPGGIGDAVHLAPVIRALGALSPPPRVDILAEQRNAGVFPLIAGIGQVMLYDCPGDWLRLFRNRYDVVIDTEQWYRLSAGVARLVRAPVKIGFATNERVRMFTNPVEYRQDDYEAFSFLRLLGPLDVCENPVSEEPWLQVPETAKKAAESLLKEVFSHPFVVIFPGASIVEKRWGIDRFYAVAKWCLEQGLQTVIVGGKEDSSAGLQFAADPRMMNLVGKTSLAETAAILNAAAVLVSGDSGVLHIAAGLGRPTVALFGPSSVKKWAPGGGRHVALLKADCSPCSRFGYTHPCPFGGQCMGNITVADVTKAISHLLHLPSAKDKS